jgi:hypothetical protein
MKSQAKQSVRDIYVGALSLKANKASSFEIRTFILKAARDNSYKVTESSGDLDVFEVSFPTGQTISFDGEELRLSHV